MEHVKEISAKYSVVISGAGQVGDGNVHLISWGTLMVKTEMKKLRWIVQGLTHQRSAKFSIQRLTQPSNMVGNSKFSITS